MSPGKKKKGKPSSFLARLLGGGGKADGAGKSAGKKAQTRAEGRPADAGAAKEKASPLTPRERSVAEVKQMARIGRRDPERLALLLTAMLAKERARQQADKASFEQQVLGIVQRSDSAAGESPGGGANAADEPDGDGSGRGAG